MARSTSSFYDMNYVVNIQNQVAATFGYTTSKDSRGQEEKDVAMIINQIKEENKKRLKELYDRLKEEEDKLRLWLGTPKEIQEKKKTWDGSGITNVLYLVDGNNSSFLQQFRDKLAMVKREWVNDEFERAMTTETSKGVNAFDQAFALEAKDLTEEKILEQFRGMYWHHNGDKNMTFRRIPPESFNMQAMLEAAKNLEDGQTTVSVVFSDNIKPIYKKRIIKIVEEVADKSLKKQKQLSIDLQKDMKDVFEHSLNINNETIKYMFLQEISQYFHNFDVNFSWASIKGFLGEAYWQTFWRWMTGGKNDRNPIPGGAFRITEGGVKSAEIPIDLFLNDIGFQVKNYSIDSTGGDKIIRMPPGKPATRLLSNFVQNQLELPGLASLLEDFFFSYGYNRTENTKHAEEIFGPVEKRFENILDYMQTTSLKALATSRIDKIINVDRIFGFDSAGMFRESMLPMSRLNTLYLIGEHIVYGSDIVQAIIYGIDNSEGVEIKVINFDFQYEQPEFGIKYPDEAKDIPMRDIMRQQKVQYQVEINMTKMIDNIFKFAESHVNKS